MSGAFQHGRITIEPKRLVKVAPEVSREKAAQVYAEHHGIDIEDARIIVDEIDRMVKAQIQANVQATMDAIMNFKSGV